ncbi:glycosyl hydrolase family 16 [Galbibacter orientalis DSM 19592]|uniref:Glycosyl hydrolase family 16 n=1 Tax=Galbibacter orientalis DSM 19592 TaxID=926559 RepID=I3CAT5_9FLAO|nr:family 16 glycosylhydrolase [Galbibacter orientalis]EIJ40728.1 glycosyl hydrolase family 16 [Galbibacter orientalis DSM 19592]
MKIQILIYLLCLLQISACDSSSVNEDEEIIPEEEVVGDPTESYTYGSKEVPANTGNPPIGTNWEVVGDFSDEFNYEGKQSEFTQNWNDTYFNAWKGPGLTEWTSENSAVSNGNLIISASRKPNTDQVYCGVISSKKKIKYPIYSEVRAKIANQVLSSNFWFLSEDDEREIDVLECYGSDRPDQTWFAARASSNTHVFIRNEESNTIIEDINQQTHHTLPNEEAWRNDFHRFGVYWKDPFTLDIYYNGVLVDEIRTDDIQDPEGLGIDREAFMIIDIEDHAWRSSQDPPIVATDEELNDANKNKYLIDYVRTYSPTQSYDGGLLKNGTFNQSELTHWYWKGEVSVVTNTSINLQEAYTLQVNNNASVIQKVTVSPNSDYRLQWKHIASEKGATLSIIGIKEHSLTTTDKWNSEELLFNSGEKSEVFIKVENKANQALYIDAFKLNKK